MIIMVTKIPSHKMEQAVPKQTDKKSEHVATDARNLSTGADAAQEIH
jgi:hypothetical protein